MKRNTKIGLILAAILFLAYNWPVTHFVNRIEPFVLGMPFLIFWEVLWIALTVIFMAIMYKVLRI